MNRRYIDHQRPCAYHRVYDIYDDGSEDRKRHHHARPLTLSSYRTLWLPGVSVPSHLTGSMAGDFGFDPLGLGQDAERVKWYAEAERTNGRWAMMAVAGILGQELLGVDTVRISKSTTRLDLLLTMSLFDALMLSLSGHELL